MRTLLLWVFLLAAGSAFAQSNEQDFSTLYHLIERRVPAMNHKVVFSAISNASKDTATYVCQNDHLTIHASSKSAAAYALSDYLRRFTHTSFSHTGDHISIPARLPQTGGAVNVAAAFPVRYALNYCTYNYTMSFWKWADWEKELDWMALSGVNLMLAPMGNELVWQRTLQELGFSDAEIRAFIPGPAFNAWWLMGNLEGWGGPVSDKMIQYWSDLQQKILARMRDLGISPVQQAFIGMVPSTLKNHFPNARIIDQGKWAGGFQRPSVLAPEDPLFDSISNIYYRNVKQLYGKEAAYLGGDLFHEGGRTGGLDVTEVGRLVQSNMQKYFPGSSWVLQGWQGNPMPAMLKGLDKKHTLVLDLMGDQGENWEKRKGYEGFPWVWCTITNFGGKTTLEGKLLRVMTEPKRALRTAAGSTLEGVGIIPEGIDNNAIVYQWTLDGAWNRGLPLLDSSLHVYIASRYGSDDPQLREAWNLMLQSVYTDNTVATAGGYESIFCARPDTNFITNVSTWGPQKLPYDPEILVQAALHFSRVAGKFANVSTYQHDLVDIWRQLINLKAREAYKGFMLAYAHHDTQSFFTYRNRFLSLLQLQDRWTGTIPEFRLGTWINQAREMLPGSAEQVLAERNARKQIAYWGPDDPSTDVHEYACKEWQGMLTEFYAARWWLFFNYADQRMRGMVVPYPDYFAFEKTWTDSRNLNDFTSKENCIQLLPEVIRETLKGDTPDDGKTFNFFSNH